MSIIDVREMKGVALASLLRRALSRAQSVEARVTEPGVQRFKTASERLSQAVRRVRMMTPAGPQSDSVEIIRSMRNE